MSYAKTKGPVLIARPGYGRPMGALGDFSSFLNSLLTGYNASQQAQGAATQAQADAAAAAARAGAAAAPAQGSFFTPTHLIVIGGVGIAAVLLLKRKKRS